MSRMKTRGVTLAVAARNGDITSRGWQITRSQERQILDFLGSPDIETIIAADRVTEMHEMFQDLPSIENTPDLEAEALDAQVASGMRSLVGTITPNGDVQMMIIYGTTEGVRPQVVAMLPDAMVVIEARNFDAWINGMKQWWEVNRRR